MKNGEVRAGIGSAELIEINGELCVLGIAMVTDLKQASEGEKVPERLSSMARRLFQAHDEERAAIARDLHDYIDRLLLLAMDLKSVSQEMDGAKRQIEDLVRDIQTLSRRLYYSKLEYLGLTAAAASFCKELSDEKNLEVEFESKGIPKELPKEISFCLFHVLREALQNATKHSGSWKFQVSLSVESDEINLTVSDSGVGFDPKEAPQGSGLGFHLMKERLK
jgi:signal transduction histidine kinase